MAKGWSPRRCGACMEFNSALPLLSRLPDKGALFTEGDASLLWRKVSREVLDKWPASWASVSHSVQLENWTPRGVRTPRPPAAW